MRNGESQEIRYVHYMQDPGFDTLAVGCVCAGHMEAASAQPEVYMQGRAGKRKRWLSRKWKISAKGYAWLRADGNRITVYRRGGGWGATISIEDNSGVHQSRKNYPTEEQAKLAAFDHITRLLATPAGPLKSRILSNGGPGSAPTLTRVDNVGSRIAITPTKAEDS